MHRITATVSLDGGKISDLEFHQHVTPSGRSESFSEITKLAEKQGKADVEAFGFGDVLTWKMCKNYLHQFKSHFVHTLRATIKAAAAQFDLPEVLVAGVAYNEVGGKDPIKSSVYQMRKVLPFTESPLKTSLGPLAIQVRRAAEALGHDPSRMSSDVEAAIIESLNEPRTAIFIAAKHLSDLRDIDFRNKGARDLSWDDILVIGARYNQGPDKPLSEIKKDLSYGKTIRRRAVQLEQLLTEVATAEPECSPVQEHVIEPGARALGNALQEFYQRALPMGQL